MGGIGNLLLAIAEIHRTLGGRIWNWSLNNGAGGWEDPTPESRAAAQTAIDAVVKAFTDAIPAPLSMGLLGVLDRAAIDAVAAKIVGAMRAYATATTR